MIARYIICPAHLMWTMLLLLHFGLPTGARAFDEADRADLIEAVLIRERQFADFSAEVSTFNWRDAESKKLEASESRRIIQWRGCFYESACMNSPGSNTQPTLFQFTWSNRESSTIYSPPDKVENYQGTRQPLVFFQPYGVLLKTLGFDGTLSQFLQRGGTGLDAWQLEFDDIGLVESGEFRSLGIRGVRKLPGSSFASTIELRLAVDHDYLPCWGKSAEVEGDRNHTRVESKVSSFVDAKGCGSLMREMQVTVFGKRSNMPESCSLIKFQGSRLSDNPGDQLFQPFEFVGNPKVFRYRDAVLESHGTYRPIPVKKTEPWSPLTIWLIVNDVTLAVLGVAYFTRFVWHRMAQFALRRRVT